MTSIRPAFRTDLFLVIALAFGTFGCAGISTGHSGGGGDGGGGGSNPVPSVQLWSGILDPSRATDWTQAGIQGGIPSRTTVCAQVSPSNDTTGTTDTTKINNALHECGSNQVVQLSAGTYYSTGLTFGSPAVNNVTLRGAGPDKTKIIFSGAIGCGQHGYVCINGSIGWARSYPGSTTWTDGYSQGTSTITVGSSAGLSTTLGAPGNIIVLDQRNDAIGICPPKGGGDGACEDVAGASERGTTVTIATSIPHGYSVGQCVGIGDVGIAGYNSESNTSHSCGNLSGWFTITAVPSPTSFQYTASSSDLAASGGGRATVDTGGVFTSEVSGPVLDEHGGIGRICPDAKNIQCQTGEISQRDQMEFKRVVAINGNQVTIDPPIEMTNWRSARAPGVWWTGNYAIADGVENLTIDMSPGVLNSARGGIIIYNAYECWVKNVRTLYGNRNHIWINVSARINVQDNYFFGTKGQASKSYGVESYSGNSNNLIQNNICQHVVSCIISGGDVGSVYAYNFAVDSGYHVPNILMGETPLNHDFGGMLLDEGEDTSFAYTDNAHGTSADVTIFRARLRAQDTPHKTNPLIAMQSSSFNRVANIIGSVLGTSSSETNTYQCLVYGQGQCIFRIGIQSEDFNVPNDPLVLASLLRWGNYDVVTGAPRWCGTGDEAGCDGISEIPTTGVAFINGNAVPESHNLPPSFYLSAQPQFWTMASGYGPTPPWPAIGPDVSGGTAPDGVAGYSYAIPAQLCYLNTPVDSSYQRRLVASSGTWGNGTGEGQATLETNSNTVSVGDVVTISGASPSGYNGTYQVISATSTSVTVFMPDDPGTYESGGIITYPNILNFNAANCYQNE
jgi:hypothetical protein